MSHAESKEDNAFYSSQLEGTFSGHFFGHHTLSTIPYIGEDNSKKCFVFSGQGSVKPGMFAEFYQSNKVIRSRFDKADLLAKDRGLPNVSDFIIAPKSIPKELLITTRILSLLTLEIAIYEYLRSVNCKPSIITSHSFGDLPAMVATDIIDFESMFDIVHHREKSSPAEHSKGYLLVAYAGQQQLLEAMPEGDYHIANINSPHETAIAVKLDKAKSVKVELKSKGVKANILRTVPHPYHSQSMLTLHQAMASYLNKQKIAFSPPEIPFYSCTLKKILTKDNFSEQDAKSIIARNVIDHVDFVTQVNTIHSQGIKHFIEIGPSPVCSAFISKILDQKPVISEFSGQLINKSKLKTITDKKTKAILSSINTAIGKVTGYEIDQISIEDKYQESLGIDSLKKVEIIVSVLEEFDISSDQGMAISEFETIEDTIEFIKRAKSSSNTGIANTQRHANFTRQFPIWKMQNPEFIFHNPMPVNNDLPILEMHNLHGGIEYVHEIYQQYWHNNTDRSLVIYSDPTKSPFKTFHTTDFREDVKSTLYPCLTFLQNILTLSKTYAKSIYLVSDSFNDPITEAVFGYLLAASKEQTSLTVKLIEFDQATSKMEQLKSIHQEKLSPDQRVRIINKQRWISCLENGSEEKTPLPKNAVVVALGGAKGITNSLLQSFTGIDNLHLYIVGRSDKNDIAVIHNISTLKSNNQNNEKDNNTVINYKSLDGTDFPALMQYMKTIIEKHGKIDLLLNGAGVVNVSMLEDKTEEDFDYEIFNKIQPAFNCLAIANELPISRVINFSSVLGRFGGAGQTLYCAANALINSLTESFNLKEHHKTAIALCWPPWDNKGMTENKLVKRQLNDLGLSLLTEEKACDLFANDLNGLNGLSTGSIYYFDIADHSRYAPSAKQHITSRALIGSIGKNLVDGFSYKKQFNLKDTDNYLSDHLVAGTPYVPAATMISMFYAISHQHHNKNITLRNIDILSPIIVNDVTLTHLSVHIQEDHLTLSLESVLTHATADSSTDLTPPPASISPPDKSSHIDIGPFYTTKEHASQRVYHGNSFQLLQHAYLVADQQVIFKIDLGNIQDIVNNLPHSRMILLLDNAFQALGISLNKKSGISTLPSKVGALSFIDNEYTLTGYILPSISDINNKRGIGDITIYNAKGAPLLCLSNVEMSAFGKPKKAWDLFKR